MPLKGLRDADNLASIIPRGVSLSNNHLRCSVPLPPIAPPPHACQTFPPVTPPPWSDAASGGRGPAPSQAKPSIVKIPLSYFYELCPLGGPRKVFFFYIGSTFQSECVSVVHVFRKWEVSFETICHFCQSEAFYCLKCKRLPASRGSIGSHETTKYDWESARLFRTSCLHPLLPRSMSPRTAYGLASKVVSEVMTYIVGIDKHLQICLCKLLLYSL